MAVRKPLILLVVHRELRTKYVMRSKPYARCRNGRAQGFSDGRERVAAPPCRARDIRYVAYLSSGALAEPGVVCDLVGGDAEGTGPRERLSRAVVTTPMVPVGLMSADIRAAMSAFPPISSASPPGADLPGGPLDFRC